MNRRRCLKWSLNQTLDIRLQTLDQTGEVFGDYRKMMGKLGERQGGKEQIENRHGTRTR